MTSPTPESRAGFFATGGGAAWLLLAFIVALAGSAATLVTRLVDLRYQRDVSRMVFNDNLQVLEDVRRRVGAARDSLNAVLDGGSDSATAAGVIVVSIADHRLWYSVANQVVFEARIATGSGKVLTRGTGLAGPARWKFETPRGRLVVQGKEADPVWVPPDWHYVETAKAKKLKLVRLTRSQVVDAGGGSVIAVSGSDVVRRYADGREEVLEAAEGREIVAQGALVVPPFGTNQRRYSGVVGTHRLNLGDGYALHGTDVPTSIGRSVSHGCVRLRNEDIETLFRIVPVGTPVFIY